VNTSENPIGPPLYCRSIALTAAGKALHPGLQAGFLHIRDAVANLKTSGDTRVLVVSTPPGFTSKWLAPRLYRFSIAYPEIDVRVSSSMNNANFTTDGVDAAIRNLPVDAAPNEPSKSKSYSTKPSCRSAVRPSSKSTGHSHRRIRLGACQLSMTTASPVAP
jgi:DNA-binding transcriptional LysR family regulator